LLDEVDDVLDGSGSDGSLLKHRRRRETAEKKAASEHPVEFASRKVLHVVTQAALDMRKKKMRVLASLTR
jgi:hypothetical protein